MEKLEKLLKEALIRDGEIYPDIMESQISGVKHILKTKDNYDKMIKYLEKVKPNNFNDVFEYAIELGGLSNQKVIIENGKNKND